MRWIHLGAAGWLWLILSCSATAGGTEVTLDGLTSVTPADWKEGEPKSRMQVRVFTLPRVEGDSADAELIIYFFGTGSGGSLEENIRRWQGMVRPEAGKTLADISKREELTVGENTKVTVLDLTGTYLSRTQPMNPNSPVKELPGHRVVFVYFASPKGPYTMRLTGPEKTVAKHLPGFLAWLKNFK
jgi:hypothetical protein